jgi:uncharacterized protein HemX
MALLVLAKPKPKTENKEDQTKPKEAQKKTRRAMTGLNAVVAVIGIAGLALFGFLMYSSFTRGGENTINVMADGIGLIISGMMVAAGLFVKMK